MRNLSLIAIILLTLSGCSSMKYSSDYDVSKDFTSYKTFMILPDHKLAPLNNLDERRVLAAVVAQMETRGYTQGEDPELLIQINIRKRREQKVSTTTVYSGYTYGGYYHSYGWSSGSGVTYTDVENYTEGTLSINLIDKEKNELIWESNAKSVMQNRANVTEQQINVIIRQMFAKFPRK